MRRAAEDQLDRIEDARDVAALLVVPAVVQVRRNLGHRRADADHQFVLGPVAFQELCRTSNQPGVKHGPCSPSGLAVQQDLRAVPRLVDFQQRHRRQRAVELERAPIPERLAPRVGRPQPRLAAIRQRHRGARRLERRRGQVGQPRDRHGVVILRRRLARLPSAICHVPSSEMTVRASAAARRTEPGPGQRGGLQCVRTCVNPLTKEGCSGCV